MNELNEKLKNKLFDREKNVDNNSTEYLLNPENNRLTIYPIQNNLIWESYKKQQAAFWTAEEIDFSKDYNDFLNLSSNEQYFIKMILAFFSSSDTIVNINLGERFMNDVKIREVLVAYSWQMMMENIHCVSGDTKILTNKGYYKIEELENQTIEVWNGKEFSSTVIKKTDPSLLYEIELNNGMILKCTPNHKWYISNSINKKDIILTKNLKINDCISKYSFPIIDFEDDNIDFNKLDDLIKYASVKNKIKWLSQIIKINGEIINNILKLNNLELNILYNIQLLLTTLNINCMITLEKKLIINSFNLNKLIKLGLILDVEITQSIENNDDIIKIQSIKILDGIHQTYCFNESKEHSGIFNGILTGQSETYSLQIDNIVKDTDEKKKLFNAIKEFPCIAEKIDWVVKWIESNDNFAIRLVAFAIVEGVFFSGSFCAIFWLKKRNIMPGLCTSNELISRDEGLHCAMAVLLYKMLEKKLDQNVIHDIFKDAVKIESKFICDSLPCALLGMNSDLMMDYIKFVADRLLTDLGYEKIYNISNPFDFMESLSVEGKTNFFEARPTQYQNACIMNKSRDNIFEFTENF